MNITTIETELSIPNLILTKPTLMEQSPNDTVSGQEDQVAYQAAYLSAKICRLLNEAIEIMQQPETERKIINDPLVTIKGDDFTLQFTQQGTGFITFNTPNQ